MHSFKYDQEYENMACFTFVYQMWQMRKLEIALPLWDRQLYIPFEGHGDEHPLQPYEHPLILTMLIDEPSGARTCNLLIAGQHFNQ